MITNVCVKITGYKNKDVIKAESMRKSEHKVVKAKLTFNVY